MDREVIIAIVAGVAGIGGTLLGVFVSFFLDNIRTKRTEKKEDRKLLATIKKEYDYYELKLTVHVFGNLEKYLTVWEQIQNHVTNHQWADEIRAQYKYENKKFFDESNELIAQLNKTVSEYETYFGKNEKFDENLNTILKRISQLNMKFCNLEFVTEDFKQAKEHSKEHGIAICKKLSENLKSMSTLFENKIKQLR